MSEKKIVRRVPVKAGMSRQAMVDGVCDRTERNGERGVVEFLESLNHVLTDNNNRLTGMVRDLGEQAEEMEEMVDRSAEKVIESEEMRHRAENLSKTWRFVCIVVWPVVTFACVTKARGMW